MCVVVCVHGCGCVDILNVWVCGCVGLLVCGCVGICVEVYGYVGVLVCKNVDM